MSGDRVEAYHARRVDQELKSAARAVCGEARTAHRNLAKLHMAHLERYPADELVLTTSGVPETRVSGAAFTSQASNQNEDTSPASRPMGRVEAAL